jgi:hypothetical protein
MRLSANPRMGAPLVALVPAAEKSATGVARAPVPGWMLKQMAKPRQASSRATKKAATKKTSTKKRATQKATTKKTATKRRRR